MTIEKRKSYEELEQDLREKSEIIEAIRSGNVDSITSSSPGKSVLLLQKIELVEERNRLLHELQESNESLLQEIKSRKLAEKDLQRALMKSQEVTKLKDKFVSLVSHDLKAPLSTMLGYLSLVQGETVEPVNPGAKTILDACVDTGHSMVKLIDDLLNISRFKTGAMLARFDFFDIYLFTIKVFASLSLVAENKKVKLINKIPEKTILYGDEILIYEVMHNIVSNAIKFCNEYDSVVITVTDDVQPSIMITDTGIGISRGRLRSLFDYEATTSTIGTAGEIGTGLGLPLCKEIIEAHNGTIKVESQVGSGTTFNVSLPHVLPVVLVVDDDAHYLKMVTKILESLDLQIVTAQNGKEGLYIAQKIKPNLMLVDLAMPEMDGYQFMEAVKKDRTLSYIPTLVLSQFGEMENREKALRLGADDFISKSTVADELIPRISKYIGYRTHLSSQHLVGSKSKKKKTGRLLLVEEEKSLSDALKSFFESYNFEILVASNESQAINIYKENRKAVDAVVVDLHIPEVDGVTLAKYNYESSFLPLVIFTSNANSKLALQLLDYGVQDYILKPVDFQQLLVVVNNAIDRFRVSSRVDSSKKYLGNLEAITISSTIADIERAIDWITRKTSLFLAEDEKVQFLSYVAEFILNAYEHGNMNIDSSTKVDLIENGLFESELLSREKQTDAKIHIGISLLKKEISISITDEGDGFDYLSYLNMTEDTMLGRLDMPSGRGIIMAKNYFDAIEYSKSGASVLLTKKF